MTSGADEPTRLTWVVRPTPAEAAQSAAEIIAEAGRQAGAERGRFTLALSGGSSTVLLERLAAQDLNWPATSIFQVDERVAPDGDPARNLGPLAATMPGSAEVLPMPVTEEDLETAAARYATLLPDSLDVVHLGVGDDGHTASLVPDDPVLDVVDRSVALCATYRGYRRMTLTYPMLDRAGLVVFFATGAGKRQRLAQLAQRDPSIPAGRVRALRQVVVCDEPAAELIDLATDVS